MSSRTSHCDNSPPAIHLAVAVSFFVAVPVWLLGILCHPLDHIEMMYTVNSEARFEYSRTLLFEGSLHSEGYREDSVKTKRVVKLVFQGSCS